MLFRLLALLILVPLAELALLFWVADYVGWKSTFLLVVGTGILGAVLARWQGLRVVGRVRSELSRGHLPTTSLLDGLMIILAAVLLATPGIMTDAFGFSLLIPVCRGWYRRRISNWLTRRFHLQSFTGGTSQGAQPRDQILEGKILEPEDRRLPDE